MFIFNVVALKLETPDEIQKSKNKIPSISEAIMASVEAREKAAEIRAVKMRNYRIRTVIRLATLIITGVSFIVSLAAIAFSSFISSMFAGLCVGVLVCYLMFEVYVMIKAKYPSIAKATISFLIAYMWFDHLLILATILHLARVFYFKFEDEGTLTRLEFLLVALDFVITLTLLAIVANIIFKGIELT